jgi:predicted transcriptional regulator
MSEYEYDKDYRFSAKWGEEVASYGFTQIPNVLISCQGHLGLTDGEFTILCHLFSYWFSQEGKVYPAIQTLCDRSGKKYSTIQKRLAGLEKKGFVQRVHRIGNSSVYNFEVCAEKMTLHVLNCHSPPHKMYRDWRKSIGIPTSKLNTKEYEL